MSLRAVGKEGYHVGNQLAEGRDDEFALEIVDCTFEVDPMFGKTRLGIYVGVRGRSAGKIFRTERRSGLERDGAFDEVFLFADVARIVVIEEPSHGIGFDPAK